MDDRFVSYRELKPGQKLNPRKGGIEIVVAPGLLASRGAIKTIQAKGDDVVTVRIYNREGDAYILSQIKTHTENTSVFPSRPGKLFHEYKEILKDAA